jgi:hypothetical protein
MIFPQEPERLLSLLPPSLTDVSTPICVVFVGSSPPTTEFLRDHAKPLIVRRERVRSALLWLKGNNQLYSDVVINHAVLNSLQDEQLLSVHTVAQKTVRMFGCFSLKSITPHTS